MAATGPSLRWWTRLRWVSHAYFLSTHRGKKSVDIDITDPQGQNAIRELARTSDILIENFKVGGLEVTATNCYRRLLPGVHNIETELGAEEPRWPGVKHLTSKVSGEYQRFPRQHAAKCGLARVHLDTYWWGSR
jgi:hypothetical protein